MKKIAIPVTSNNQINDHFGKCESYKLYTILESNEIIAVESMAAEQGCGCKSNIASELAQANVTTMLAGGIGQGAINVLGNNNIEVVRGCSGDADAIAKLYVDGLILDSGETCQQHEKGEEHQCNH